jgi:hypothetical protein
VETHLDRIPNLLHIMEVALVVDQRKFMHSQHTKTKMICLGQVTQKLLPDKARMQVLVKAQ